MKRIIAGIAIMIAVFFLAPFLAVKLLPDDSVMGVFVILFFGANPIVMGILGILAGTDRKKLWWLPILAGALFPLLHALAIWSVPVWSLYYYSIIYIMLGYLSTVATSFLIKIRQHRA